MKLPFEFPNEADKIYAEAQAVRRLSVAERVRAIGRLTRACQSLSSLSPQRDATSRLREEDDDRLRRHLQEMAARHGN
jgi:hypothetical protein